jgi:hypothetical protein
MFKLRKALAVGTESLLPTTLFFGFFLFLLFFFKQNRPFCLLNCCTCNHADYICFCFCFLLDVREPNLQSFIQPGFLISVINTKRSNATSTSKSGARGAVPAKENGRRATDNRLSTQSSQMAKKKLNKSPPKNMEEVVKRVYKHVAPSGGLPNPSSAVRLSAPLHTINP